MFFVSVRTRVNFSPARKVRSTTAPEPSAFSFVRTNAPPLPGLTCWNSTMRQTSPSSSMCIPFLNWFVETVSATAAECSPRLRAARGDGRRGCAMRRRAEHDHGLRDDRSRVVQADQLVGPGTGVQRVGSLDVEEDAVGIDGQVANHAVPEEKLDVCD